MMTVKVLEKQLSRLGISFKVSDVTLCLFIFFKKEKPKNLVKFVQDMLFKMKQNSNLFRKSMYFSLTK